MGDVNLEIKLSNLDERVIKIEESGGGSGGDDYITSVSNDFNVVNKKLSLSNNVTTKLSKVDTPDNLSVELAKKIDKPASATEGQVLTYNATSGEWEAKDSQGGGIEEPTELEKGIIGGDEYNSETKYSFNDSTKPNSCIKNNKIYTVKSSVTSDFSNIEPTVTSGWDNYWEETSISTLSKNLIGFRFITKKTTLQSSSFIRFDFSSDNGCTKDNVILISAKYTRNDSQDYVDMVSSGWQGYTNWLSDTTMQYHCAEGQNSMNGQEGVFTFLVI